jgi:hypothetical protein
VPNVEKLDHRRHVDDKGAGMAAHTGATWNPRCEPPAIWSLLTR